MADVLYAVLKALQTGYGLNVQTLTRVPGGADPLAETYRAETTDGGVYFIKKTRRPISEVALKLPAFLHESGLDWVIAPLPAKDGSLSLSLRKTRLIVYPYVECARAYQRPLTQSQWQALGRMVHCLHEIAAPFALPAETYGSEIRDVVAEQLRTTLPARLEPHRSEVEQLLAEATRLAEHVSKANLPLCICHTDLHAWNVVTNEQGQVLLVDWDEVRLAPRERDLMFIGGGVGGPDWCREPEISWFYEGYGSVPIDLLALAYFRCERVLADIAVAEAHQDLSFQFARGEVAEIALATISRGK
ncbi:MAG: phosphotransferase [Armatimonas sp.]